MHIIISLHGPMTTKKGYGDEYYHNGCAFVGGPVCTMVIIDGKKYIYEVEGKK